MTQYTTTSTLETQKRKVPCPRKGEFNFYTAKNGVLKVKNSKCKEQDVVLDRELEGFNIPNTFGITDETTVIEAMGIIVDNIPTDINQLTDVDNLLNNCETITYTGLVYLRDNNLLERGKRYAIWDYVPCWNIFDGGTMDIIEDQAGIGEVLIVTAASVNTIFKEAISASHPSDTIYYSLDLLDDRDIGFGDGAGTPIAIFKGMVYYRKDTVQNVETHYDFRNIKFRRWAVDAVVFDNGTAYVERDVCKSGVDGKIYKCITATTGEGDPTVNTADWVLWLDITTDAFVSWTADKTQFNIGDITTDNLIINNTTAGVDYDDFYTFGDYYNWVKDVSIEFINLDFIIPDGAGYYTTLNNIVFKTQNDSATLHEAIFENNCYNQTFQTGANRFRILYYSYNNVISIFFQYNIMCLAFTIIQDSASDNNISRLTQTLIGNGFTQNSVLLSFPIQFDFSNATHVYGGYSCTIYKDKTDGVKLSYMDGGVMQIVDVTA